VPSQGDPDLVADSARLERELATLSALATATGDTRSRAAFAERAMALLVEHTGAQHGAIAVMHEGTARIVASVGITEAIERATAFARFTDSPALRLIATPGRVIKGAVDRMPLLPATRVAFIDAGIELLVVVGLHRDDELFGLLTLGWHEADPTIPADEAWRPIAATIARGLENGRLLEEIVRRADHEREAATRLRALDELTRLPDSVATLQELSDRSARIVHTVMGATGTAYGLLHPDGTGYATWSLVEVHPMVEAWLQTSEPDVRTAFRRWRGGEGPVFESFEPGVVPMPMVELARAAGLTGYAGFPLRIGDEVVGAALAYFDRPLAEVHVDRTMLDRVAVAMSVALSTFRMRERVDAADRRFRTLFESSPDPLFIEKLDGTVVEVNDAAERVFRADRARLIGRIPSDLAVEEPSWPRLMTAVQEPGAAFRVRATGIRSDGERFPQEVDIRRVELEGEPRLLIRIRDLTEQERLQAELIQAQKMEATGHLVTGVAHELNNPLAAILGFSQLIRRDQALPDDLRHNADLLVGEATRTRRIVEDLLDFARQRPPERYPTPIASLVESVVTLMTYQLGTSRIALEVEVEPDLPPVELDRSQLQQVLVNLVQNAIDAMAGGSGSKVRLVASLERHRRGDHVRITVLDDGPGVPPDHVERLFEAFFTSKPSTQGTGLGLPVSAGIVRSHGGELRYVPSPLGRGAAFTFDLPVRAVVVDQSSILPALGSERDLPEPTAAPAGSEPAASAEPAVAEPPSTRPSPVAPPASAPPGDAGTSRPRVLVLDDEPSIRVFMTKALAGLGYEAVTTGSGPEAIERALDGAFAAYVIDHHVDGGSGVEVFDAVVAARPDDARRFVLMSGDVRDPTLAALATARGVGLLAKPFDLDTLDRTVRALVGGAGDQPRGYV
jgi:PAS domain S-box-containing protein